ncbi:MAG: hypothetical protein ACU85E_15390 [Gammaproteobacteria bacterium]
MPDYLGWGIKELMSIRSKRIGAEFLVPWMGLILKSMVPVPSFR